MRVVNKEINATNSHIIKLIDLSLNLNLCILKNKRKLTLRILEEDIKEEKEKIQNLLNNAIEIYKNIIFEDINSHSFDKIIQIIMIMNQIF